MIRLASRETVFKNPFAAAVIGPRQQEVVKCGIEDFDNKTGTSGPGELSGSWADAPSVPEGLRNLKRSILCWPAQDLRDFEKTFPDKLSSVCEKLGVPDLYLALSLKMNWFIQANNFPPAKEALETLYRFTFRKPYFEAYYCGLQSLPLLALTAFRLGRYCAALPEMFFIAAKGDFAFQICQFGNFHIEVGQTFHDVLTTFLEAGFTPVESDTERFGDGAIEGREIIV